MYLFPCCYGLFWEGYYEGIMMVRFRSVDTPGRGVVRDPLDIRRAEIF